MFPSWMKWDQLQKFNRCLIDNGNGTFSLRTTAGSSSGTTGGGVKRSGVMNSFEKSITTSFAVRIA